MEVAPVRYIACPGYALGILVGQLGNIVVCDEDGRVVEWAEIDVHERAPVEPLEHPSEGEIFNLFLLVKLSMISASASKTSRPRDIVCHYQSTYMSHSSGSFSRGRLVAELRLLLLYHARRL